MITTLQDRLKYKMVFTKSTVGVYDNIRQLQNVDKVKKYFKKISQSTKKLLPGYVI